jgi:hypothetical protein
MGGDRIDVPEEAIPLGLQVLISQVGGWGPGLVGDRWIQSIEHSDVVHLVLGLK